MVDPTKPRRRTYLPNEVQHEEPLPEPINDDEDDEDFAAMFSQEALPPRPHFELGMSVEGTIIQIGQDFAYVDLGSKAEAAIAVDELKGEDGHFIYHPGDAIKAKIASFDGGIKLSRSGGASFAVEEAFLAGLPVNGRVESTNKGGFEVAVLGQRAFCPISHIDRAYTEDPSIHLGATYAFKITEYDKGGRRFVVSRKALLEEEDRVRREELRTRLKVGAILEGKVRSLRDYGAFVDIGGIDGLVHVSEIAHTRIKHPSEVLKEGDDVRVLVLEHIALGKTERISLSIKQLLQDPWTDAPNWLFADNNRTGTVTKLMPFGAFVELAPGIEGLIHLSEMRHQRVNNPAEVLDVGNVVDVRILSVDPENKRISLSLKATLADPWLNVDHDFPVGALVTGTVDHVADFGVFVALADGIVALLPKSELGQSQRTSPMRDFTPGNEVQAHVLAVDTERKRITLSLKEQREGEPESTPRTSTSRNKGHAAQPQQGAPTSYQDTDAGFATLGDLLAKQLKVKK